MFSVTPGSVPSLPLYQRLAKADVAAEAAKFAERPQIKRAIDDFRKKVALVKSPKQFVEDTKLLRFALSAYGLEGELNFLARTQQAILSDEFDPRSVVNRMRSIRMKEVTVDFGFAQVGIKNLQKPEFIDKLIGNYITNQYEAEFGKTSPGLRDALYFTRKIKSVSSILQVLGDRTLRDVVAGALNIPPEVANQPLAKQVAAFEAKFKVSQAKDSVYVESVVKRYLGRQDAQVAAGRTNPVFLLFAGGEES